MILLSILVGMLLTPVILGLLVIYLNKYRERNGLSPLPADKLSWIIILLTLISWAIVGINILVQYSVNKIP